VEGEDADDFEMPTGDAYKEIDENSEHCQCLSLGPMDLQCTFCHALHWPAEKLSKSAHALFGNCCISGKVKIPYIEAPPPELMALFNGTGIHSAHFLKHDVSYNNALL
jgi:hypothetical protein